MLSFVIKPYELAFTFQILSQDSIIEDAINSVGGSFHTSNGWTIRVKNSPELKVVSKRIYLRGANSALDYRIDRTWNFSSNVERDMYISEIRQAMAEIISFADAYDDSRYYGRDSFTRSYGCDCTEDREEFSISYRKPIKRNKTKWYSGIWYAPEAYLFYNPCIPRYGNPASIDANGWGNNKPKDRRIAII